MTKTATKRVRREYGEGSIFYEESRSRWVGLMSLPKKDGKGQPRKKFTGKTRQEVIKKLREAKRDLEEGKGLGTARDTVAALLSDWQERGYPMTRAKTGNTHAGYEWSIDHLTGPEGIGGFRLSDLTADDVESFLTEKVNPTGSARPLGHRSVVQILRVLRTALQWGKRRGRVRQNVAVDVMMPAEGSRRPSRAFKPEEVTALLVAAYDADKAAMKHSGSSGRATPLEAAWSVMVGMGLRPGECFALSWESIEWDAPHNSGDGRGVLFVTGSLVRDQEANTLYVGPPKTAMSRSRMDIPLPVLDALRAHRKWQMSAGIATGLVFTNESGGLLDPSAVRRRFKKLCCAAGLPDDRHPHELRHSCGSYLSVIGGMPAEQVADVLRHSDVRTFLQVYRHPDVAPSVGGALGTVALFPVRPAADAG